MWESMLEMYVGNKEGVLGNNRFICNSTYLMIRSMLLKYNSLLRKEFVMLLCVENCIVNVARE